MKINQLARLFIVASMFLPALAWAVDVKDGLTFTTNNYCQGCDLTEATIFEDHDSGSLLNSFAIKTVFLGSLYKMDFSGSIMTYAKFGVNFINYVQKVQEANFNQVNLSFASIRSADLSGVNLSNAMLSGAEFSHVNLSGVNFDNANLSNASIRHSNLIGAKLTDAQLGTLETLECSVMPNGDLNNKGCE